MTPADTSALRALQEAFESGGTDDQAAAYLEALVNAAPDLLDELDQLRGQVARVEAWYGWRRGTDAPDEALAAPADTEGGECGTCGEGDFPQNECPESKRPCGHHCNHVWTHDQCDWCGKHFDAEGGEHVHLFESDGCINVGCTTQVCASCGHVENPHIEGCMAVEGGE